MEESKLGRNCNIQDISLFTPVSHETIAKGRKSKSPHGLSDHETIDYFVSTFLVSVSKLVIKTIGFQFNAFVSVFTFPMMMMYYSVMFVVDPFRMFKWARNRAIGMLLTILDRFTPLLNGHKLLANLFVRLCWGFFWAVYVCFLLFGLLVMGFVIGGVTMRYVVEEPIQKTEVLNFDYTHSSPVAFVPVMSCPTVSCGVHCKENIELDKYVGSRVIPPNHKLQVAVSLTLPESDYNRNLGIFQVRVEYISAMGEVMASPSYPCMLRFKSQLIRYMDTLVISVPLLAGYTTESQTLDLKMRGFTEGDEPTSCVKVILEQRAEFKPSGTGIPEIYAASLELKSELSLVKRILWYWRRTVFVWLSICVFMVELVFGLICCKPVIMPKARARRAKKNAHENNVPRIKGD